MCIDYGGHGVENGMWVRLPPCPPIYLTMKFKYGYTLGGKAYKDLIFEASDIAEAMVKLGTIFKRNFSPEALKDITNITLELV